MNPGKASLFSWIKSIPLNFVKIMDKINFVFVTQSEPFYIKNFFRVFLANYNHRDEIKGVIIQKTLNEKSKSGLYKKALYFYGLYGFIIMGFRFVFLNFIGFICKLTGISYELTIEGIFKKHGIAILSFESVNSQEFMDFVKKEDISLIISVAASEIFRKEILETPPNGCVNMHSGPLPRYRGMMPNFWTLYNREEYAWISIHQMTERIDDGAILLQDRFKIPENITYHELAVQSKVFGARLMNTFLKKMRAGDLKPITNDTSLATYYTFPSKQEVAEFRKKGGRII